MAHAAHDRSIAIGDVLLQVQRTLERNPEAHIIATYPVVQIDKRFDVHPADAHFHEEWSVLWYDVTTGMCFRNVQSVHSIAEHDQHYRERLHHALLLRLASEVIDKIYPEVPVRHEQVARTEEV